MVTTQKASGSIPLGAKLRIERLRRREGQEEAGRRFGVSQATFSKWERGFALPDQERFAVVADYIGATVEEVWTLVHGRKDPLTLSDALATIESMKRDIADLRAMNAETRQSNADLAAMLAELRAMIVESATQSAAAPPAPSRSRARRKG
jgi:transcriptional regulator with XRE-family HTH domain